MQTNNNIYYLSDLRKVIDVVPDYAIPKTNYMVDYNSNCDIIIRTYVKGEEDERNVIEADELLLVENFEEFFKKAKGCLPENSEFSVSEEYALMLLASINGGEPEDYEDNYSYTI